MRSNNSNFNLKNQSGSKSIRLVIEIDFSDNGTDLYYFTSHSDIPTVTPVIHGVLKNTSSISQKLIPERANSSIGSLSFELVDVGSAITSLFNTKRASRKVLFGKRVRLYLGYEGLAWADYRIEQTQYIDKKINFRKGVYHIPCRDAQDRLNKPIMEPLKTRLSVAISSTDTTISVYDTAGWALVARDADHTDAPSTSVTYLEISDGSNKEWCRVTAIGSSFTVVRGALGTVAQAWTLPVDASDEKGPQVTELIFVEMDSLKLAYAVMTGVLLNQSGATLPDHWHLGLDESLFTSTEFTGGFIAYAIGLKKTDGKKFIESEIMLPNSRYLRVNGAGNMDLKRIFAIQDSASPVAVIDETKITKFNDLEFDSSNTTNKFEIEWSYDSLPKKAQYRRKSTFIFADSVTDYGEKTKPLKFRLVNGIRATTSTMLNIVNSFADRFAGEAARLKLSVLPSSNDLEVGDVISIQHPSIRDFNSGATINRSMQIISTKVDQKKGLVDLDLFGSTFAPDPLTDGSVRVLNDSFYTAAGIPLANVTSNSLTVDTTLTGTADHNSSVVYHNADLTIPAGVTLTIKDNVQLRVMGHITVLGSINCVGNGKATEGYIGTSVGATGRNIELNDGEFFDLARTPGEIIEGQFEAFPSLDLDNAAGNSVSGVPTDLRGTGGATGGQGSYTDELGTTVTAAGGTGNDGGSGLVIICRGMSLSGSGAIDMSGISGNAGATTAGVGGTATGGDGGHSTPGGLLVLLDGGTSSAPDFTGRLTAIGNKLIDIKTNAARVQFIPQPRTPLADDPISDPQQLYTWIKYADDAAGTGITDDPTGKSYVGFSVNNTSPVESLTPSDYEWSKFIGAQGIAGPAGANGQTSYFHVAYADDNIGTGFTQSPTGKDYIGTYVDFTATDSTNPALYTWVLVKGSQGPTGNQGIPGVNGADGQTSYLHIAYADSADGVTNFNQTGGAYIGQYTDFTATDSTNPALYTWTKILGATGSQGVPGDPGADGQTTYTWVKYADSSDGLTGFSDSPTGKKYIGLAFNKTTATESANAADYTWSRYVGADKVNTISLTLNDNGSASSNNSLWLGGTNEDGTTNKSIDGKFWFNGVETTAFKSVYKPPASTSGEFFVMAPLPSSALPPGIISKSSPGPSSAQLLIDGGIAIWDGAGNPSGAVGETNEQFVAVAKYVTDGIRITSASILTPASVAELSDFRATSNNQHIVTSAPASSLGKDGDFAHVQPGGAGTAITDIYLKIGGAWEKHEQNTFSTDITINGGHKQGKLTVSTSAASGTANEGDTWEQY